MKEINTINRRGIRISTCVTEKVWTKLVEMSDKAGFPVSIFISDLLSMDRNVFKRAMTRSYKKEYKSNESKTHQIVLRLDKNTYENLISAAEKFHITKSKMLRVAIIMIIDILGDNDINEVSNDINEVSEVSKETKKHYTTSITGNAYKILKNIAALNNVSLSKLAISILTNDTSHLVTNNPKILLIKMSDRINRNGVINIYATDETIDRMLDIYGYSYGHYSITKMMSYIILDFINTVTVNIITDSDEECETTFPTSNSQYESKISNEDKEFEVTFSSKNRRYESKEEMIVKKDEVVRQICDVLNDNNDVNDIVVNVRFTKKFNIYNMYIKF